MREQSRKIGSVGLSCNRYNFILKGNNSKMAIQTWAPHKRLGCEEKFVSKPDVWYTIKMKVETTDDQATIFAKVWERETDEPEEWTLTKTDPHPNHTGSPGLYYYALADCDFDNVIVTQK